MKLKNVLVTAVVFFALTGARMANAQQIAIAVGASHPGYHAAYGHHPGYGYGYTHGYFGGGFVGRNIYAPAWNWGPRTNFTYQYYATVPSYGYAAPYYHGRPAYYLPPVYGYNGPIYPHGQFRW